MEYSKLDTKSEEFKMLFGGFIEVTEDDDTKGRNHSLVNYVSGIGVFDEFLEGVKFSNTDLKHRMYFTEHGVIFALVGINEIVNFNLLKKDIESIVVYHNQEIEILDVNQVLNILKTGFGGSGVGGVLLTSLAAHATSSILNKFKPHKSKTVVGSIYEIRTAIFKEQKGVIRLSCRDEFKYILNKILDKHLNFGLSTNDPKERCFIATVCYEDPNSTEVINLRKFRDNYLKKCIIGNWFIRIYYIISPCLSNIMYKNRMLKKITHTLFVRPIYQVINYIFNL